MGLAASQGRLLLLTARKSDLEYQSQQISQRRLLLSQQNETIAKEYSEAIGNRVLMFNYDIIQNSTNYTATETLSWQGLVATKKANGEQYRVVDAMGRVIVPSLPDGRITIGGQEYDTSQLSDEQLEQLVGNTWTHQDGSSQTPTEYVLAPAILSPEVFQQGLRNGVYFIQSYSSDTSLGNATWNDVSWQSMEEITDTLNTEDDAYAQSVYETKTAMIQSQDKKLELELKQIETVHKAVETEVESVNKVIQKNIETSFKMFQA